MTGYRTLLLVRHGDYDSTIEFPDDPDGSLNERGRKQSAYVAAYLHALKPDVIYHSTLIRASETVQIIAARCQNVPLYADDDLRECIPVVPAGLEKPFEGIPTEFILNGPAQSERAFARYFKALDPDEPNSIEVILSHGNLIGYMVARVMNAPAESWLRADIGNGCITEVRIAPSGFMKLMRHNDSAHLPPELLLED